MRHYFAVAAIVVIFALSSSFSIAADAAARLDAKAVAKIALDPAESTERREQALAESVKQAPEIIAAMTADLKPGTPAEYDRIPWIWRISIAAARTNDGPILEKIIDVASPNPTEPLHDWQAVVLGGGVINALSERGLWPCERVDEILKNNKSLRERWLRAIEQSSAMADNEKVSPGTRYDALRMIAMVGWNERGKQLVGYLSHENAELQMGAVSGLVDVNAIEAADALIAALPKLVEHNRALAWQGLMRSKERMNQVLNAVEVGELERGAIPDDVKQRLQSAQDDEVRSRAKKLLDV
jgi:hypothetical protein